MCAQMFVWESGFILQRERERNSVVCVCVCVRERERKREREREGGRERSFVCVSAK